MPSGENNDAQLVLASMAGDRDAFGEIVGRYQSLVCSLAYSATGSLGQSEDLAQETFITAWKHLAQLRQRDHLRAWLCGIARNRINHFLRREGRQPLRRAEPLENVAEAQSPEPAPEQQAISHEELELLWRALERVPEIYREPLVLFYREHESVERVAAALGLSQEAVHQRLSRGRTLLQEQVLGFVESALKKTAPTKAFTLGVLAALPLLSTTAKAAISGTAAAKGGAMVKAAGLATIVQGFLKLVLPAGAFLTLSGWLGYRMGRDAEESTPRRRSVARLWVTLVGVLCVFVLLPLLFWVPLMNVFASKEAFLRVLRVWWDIMFVIMAVALGIWIWQRRTPAQARTSEGQDRGPGLFLWGVAFAVLAATAFIVLGLHDTNFRVHDLNASQVQALITENRNQDLDTWVFQYQNGEKQLMVKLVKNGTSTTFDAAANNATLTLLKQRGIGCPVSVQGRDFEIFGWEGKLLVLGVCPLVLMVGLSALGTFLLKNRPRAPLAQHAA